MLWWSVEGTVAKAALMAMTERRAHIFASALCPVEVKLSLPGFKEQTKSQ